MIEIILVVPSYGTARGMVLLGGLLEWRMGGP
jgi:hypothetical protein